MRYLGAVVPLLVFIIGVGMAKGYTEELSSYNEKNFILHPYELEVIDRVASKYELSPEEKRLLLTIRKVENGGPGREYGVLNPKAMRYKDDPIKSVETQAEWAAGTIKARYTGDLEAFAARWAPIGAKNDPKCLNKNWVVNASTWMNLLEGSGYGND